MQLKEIYKRWPLVTMICIIVVVALCSAVVTFAVGDNNDLTTQAIITSIMAVISVVILALFIPRTLRGVLGEQKSFAKEDTSVVCSLVLIGLIGGICSVVFFMFGISTLTVDAAATQSGTTEALFDPLIILQRLLPIVIICIATGIYEEGLFRGIVVTCVQKRVKKDYPDRSYALITAVISALIFGILHAAGGSAYSADTEALSDSDAIAGVLVAANGVAKVIQASLFGFCMAALFMRFRSIWLPVIIHAGFDFLSMEPSMALTGLVPNTYLTADVGDLIVVVLTACLLLFPCYKSLQWLRRNTG